MTDTVLEPQTSPPTRMKLQSQHIAWIILLGAFAIFCVICIVTGFSVSYFLFQSTVPMQVALAVGRGTASYVDSDLVEKVVPRDGHFVSTNQRISTDLQSQATIFVRDSYQPSRLIAAVTMKGGTSLNMDYALRPRFEWSSVQYQIDLTNVSGDLDVYVPEGLGRGLWLSIRSESGALVYLTDSGQYTVNMSDAQTQVYNREGRAVIITPSLVPRDVPQGQRGLIAASDSPNEIAVAPAPVNLLQNSQVQTMPPADVATSNMLLADLVRPWQCGDIQSEPPGSYGAAVLEGRPAIHLARGDGATSHGETFCSQLPGPGQTGRDVSSYNSLAIKTTFYIESHSLSTCGINGSECPLMLQLDYVYRDELGREQPNQWFHGFYATADPLADYPPRCSSCIQDHENVYPHRWYTYDSGNLFALISSSLRPISILRVKFYASGHEYDVYVADVALLAG